MPALSYQSRWLLISSTMESHSPVMTVVDLHNDGVVIPRCRPFRLTVMSIVDVVAKSRDQLYGHKIRAPHTDNNPCTVLLKAEYPASPAFMSRALLQCPCLSLRVNSACISAAAKHKSICQNLVHEDDHSQALLFDFAKIMTEARELSLLML